MKRWLQTPHARRWGAVLAGLLLVIAIAAWNWQGIRIWYHMAPIGEVVPQLGEFDASKAQSLSPQRRVELERELFGELWMWNGSSRRYGPPNGRAERQVRWIEMAKEGSELAYLTLKVLPPDSFARDPRPTLKRLDEMAQQGDAAAMCLYGGIVFQLPYWAADWTPQEERARYWVIKGAELGHPACWIRLGGWRIWGYVAPADAKQGSEMIYEALRKGYDFDVSALRLRAHERNYVDVPSRKLEYCWAYHQAKNSVYEPDLSMNVYINSRATLAERESLNRELDQLRQWHPSIEDCIKLTQQTFGE